LTAVQVVVAAAEVVVVAAAEAVLEEEDLDNSPSRSGSGLWRDLQGMRQGRHPGMQRMHPLEVDKKEDNLVPVDIQLSLLEGTEGGMGNCNRCRQADILNCNCCYLADMQGTQTFLAAPFPAAAAAAAAGPLQVDENRQKKNLRDDGWT